jgi:hypothetical protein
LWAREEEREIQEIRRFLTIGEAFDSAQANPFTILLIEDDGFAAIDQHPMFNV